jgi:hypothetical protein
MQDTLGELQLRILLEGEKPTAADTATATAATAEWGGDRIGLYEGPGGTWAVVLRTNWRTSDGGVSFRNAIAASAARMSRTAKVCGTALYLASDAATLAAFASC